MPTLPTNKKPIPMPKHTPCDKNNCQMASANDAPIKLAVSNTMPMVSVTFVPNMRVVSVASGETSMAQEMDSEPTNAYSSALAPGKVLVAR